MPPTTRVPPLLQPYTSRLQKDHLVLLTGILGASTNWLLIRYLCGALAPTSADDARRRDGEEIEATQDAELETAVILVSWMRDWDFWKTESRRAGGLDLARLAQQNKLCFIDGLSSLGSSKRASSATIPHNHPSRRPPAISATTSTPRYTPAQIASAEVIQRAHASLNSTSPKKIILILDQPDLLLAATEASGQIKPAIPPVTAATLADSLLHLRASAYATIVTLAADAPLVSAAAALDGSGVSNISNTPLETEHAAFLTGQAHVADWVMGCRLLDTGFAADVSGVLRITKGGAGDEEDYIKADEEGKGEKEVLYYVGGDGGVSVFERGSGGGHE
ncbi:hypothetical protein K490DRAFT_71738 [Saccharata proteae CBS 121410]|uniref:Uncharacterized protein n=1 Tax=Saccharata proteae CBS 121410 TaxID=1314787 RepID=A0A9P4M0D7_9PEZI|nr:hypothetical protein K490DRAFT_71738 [Saccharata proteae CBS 121410]